jgi:hypothetical protein
MTRQAFVWEEVEMWTVPDVVEVLSLIMDQDEADSFMEAYDAVQDESEHMVGYLVGLTDEEDRDRLRALFGVEETIQPLQLFNNSSLGVKVAD